MIIVDQKKKPSGYNELKAELARILLEMEVVIIEGALGECMVKLSVIYNYTYDL